MIIESVVLALGVVWALIFATSAGWLAGRRDRSVPMWIVFGAILGGVALFLLWIAPPGRCSHCRAPVRGWIGQCDWCGMDVRPTSGSAPRSRPEAVTGRARRPPMASPVPRTSVIAVAPGDHPMEPLERATVATVARVANAAPDTRDGTEAIDRVAPPSRGGAIEAGASVAGMDGSTLVVVAPPLEMTSTAVPSSVDGKAVGGATPEGTTPADPETPAPAPKTTSRRARAKTATAATGPAKPVSKRSVRMKTITSAIFVTGTVGLTPGSRYTIRHDGDQLQVLGPTDRSPRKVAFERRLAETDATAPEDRLILSTPGTRGDTVLIFMGVDGDPAVVAAAVNRAAATGPS